MAERFRLLPRPRECASLPGSFPLTPTTRIAAGQADSGAVSHLIRRIGERTGVQCAPGPGAIQLVREREGDPEAFDIRVTPTRVRIHAPGAAGLRYGAETLAQLAEPGGRIPGAQIRDAPALRQRGFLLDVSRGRVPRVTTLRALVELLARLRYNQLYLYTEHTFRFRRHPEIGEGAGSLSAGEMRELDAFARERHVDLVPCLQTFGHLRRILELPGYRRIAESDRLWSVSPEDPGTYRLLADLLEEYLPCFSSGFAHLNCDEPIDLGEGRSKLRAEREGLAAVFAGHVNRVAAMARRLGKRPMIWADVLADHPRTLEQLDEDIVLTDWWYEADHDFDRVARFREAGRRFLSVAGTSSWTSLFPRLPTALPNIIGHARAAKRFGGDGFLLTDWGDGGHYNFFSGSLYPLAFGAEAAWGQGDPDEAAIRDAFSELVAGDPSGFAGAFASRLGRLHEVGFPHFNHSPLKTVFFETRLKTASRVPDEAVLRRTREDLRTLADDARSEGLPGGVVGAEWGYALDASLLAAERGLATLAYRSGSGDTAALHDLAVRQRALRDRFKEVWLMANRPQGIRTALERHRDAADALERAARQRSRQVGPA